MAAPQKSINNPPSSSMYSYDVPMYREFKLRGIESSSRWDIENNDEDVNEWFKVHHPNHFSTTCIKTLVRKKIVDKQRLESKKQSSLSKSLRDNK
mmetsp:Transcript_55766/g.67227  ORF Transcript_55766/g.67227 Transcript_55766/m.67227 type:complete len:95 (-) Transcript_55766:38-322(-)